jgi:hypothetical protein
MSFPGRLDTTNTEIKKTSAAVERCRQLKLDFTAVK